MMVLTLRVTVRTLKTIVLWLGAYEYHVMANRSADRLRMASDPELKDFGINRSSIAVEAHSDCPWCHKDKRWET